MGELEKRPPNDNTDRVATARREPWKACRREDTYFCDTWWWREEEQGYLCRRPGKWVGGGWQGAHHVPSLSAPQAFLPPYSSPHSNIWGASFLQGDFSTSLLRNPNVTRQISSRLEKGEASSPHESHWAERERQCTVVQRWRGTGVPGSRVAVRLAGRGK